MCTNKFKSCRKSNNKKHKDYFELNNSYDKNNEICVALEHAFKIEEQNNMPEAIIYPYNSNSNNE